MKVSIIRDLTPYDCNIKWRLTDLCSIHCSYCGRRNHTISKWSKDQLQSEEDKLVEVATEISRMINRTNFNKVRLELIGGEVTVFNLIRIISNIDSDKIKSIRLTSNTIKSENYYIELADYLHSRGIEVSICFSLHSEFQSIDRYFNKIEKLIGKIDILTCEIPSLATNQDLCREFIDRCEKLNVNYLVDADIRNRAKQDRLNGLITDSKSINKNNRYQITFTDGSSKLYSSRSQFLTDKSIDENKDLKYIHTDGMYCTNSYNYVYIEFDKVNGRSSKDSPNCHELIPIKDFKFIDSPAICMNSYCTICGNFSLYRSEGEL